MADTTAGCFSHVPTRIAARTNRERFLALQVTCPISERCTVHGHCTPGSTGDKCDQCEGNHYPVHDTCEEASSGIFA